MAKYSMLILLMFGLVAFAAFGGGQSDSSSPAETSLTGNPLRGGLLYDKWWSTLEQGPPSGNQPLWDTQSTNARNGSDTWRCKECHGWDYKGAKGAYKSGSHATGFIGVLDAAKKGADYAYSALNGETNSDHDFSSVMDSQALTDLALFISDMTMDFDVFIGSDKMALGGDTAKGQEIFDGECAKCHGRQGTAINFKNQKGPEYLGGLAQGNPWEFAHKLRFGQPRQENMPSAIDKGWAEDQQLSVIAYAQRLPNSSPIVEGGVLYDKWWNAIGVEKPEDDHPLWSTQSTNTRSGADTWRCKECHGWDYKGAEGAYASGSHRTGFTGIMGAKAMSAQNLTGWLNGSANPQHDFSMFLGEDQINMLVAFMADGLVDMAGYINSDKTVAGDAGNGKKLYEGSCARCHGNDGKQIKWGYALDSGAPHM